ncbi:splicing regulator SDE2-like [Clavelina lepadiformis]|uniref:splicing regulator SDE2-like n=1 Tax=Clavelina lepadiformis TaxID=159417 RepID=UPI004042B0AE
MRVQVHLEKLFVPAVEVEVNSSCTMAKFAGLLFNNNVLPSALKSSIYLTRNGLCAKDDDILVQGDYIAAHVRLRGGKGGFGSMLRALGSQIEKTTNMEACRDLSGRRMRDVNNEKKMMEWIKKKADNDRKKEQEKIEKLEKQLQRPKHYFNDPDYERKLEEATDNVEDALKKGLTAQKRKAENLPSSSKMKSSVDVKRSKLWFSINDSTDSSSDSDGEDINPRLSMKQGNGFPESSSSLQDESFSTSINTDSSKTEDNEVISAPPQKEQSILKETSAKLPAHEEDISQDGDEAKRSHEEKSSDDASAAGDDPTRTSTPDKEDEKKQDISDIDLSSFNNVEELKSLGPEALKSALIARGMKCGGDLTQRAERLFSVKGLNKDEIPTSLLAKKKLL